MIFKQRMDWILGYEFRNTFYTLHLPVCSAVIYSARSFPKRQCYSLVFCTCSSLGDDPPLPRLIRKVGLFGHLGIIPRLLQIHNRHIIIRHLARHHPPPYFRLARLFLLPLDRPRGQAYPPAVVPRRYYHRPPRREEVVAAEAVSTAEGISGDVVAKGEGGDGVVIVVEEVERVLGGRGEGA